MTRVCRRGLGLATDDGVEVEVVSDAPSCLSPLKRKVDHHGMHPHEFVITLLPRHASPC